MASTKNPPKLSTNPDVASSEQELEDIAKAIELSLKDVSAPRNKRSSAHQSSTGGSNSRTSHHKANHNHSDLSGSSGRVTQSQALYPSFEHQAGSGGLNDNHRQQMESTTIRSLSPKESFQVRALYDFEAAEDNELTFKTGELIVVLDDSDSNWWKGSNHRGEGLFPSNFVTADLSEPESGVKSQKTVQFNEEVKVKLLEAAETVVIDEQKIDHLLFLLHEADPTSDTPDSEELLTLEEQCSAMNPLIDQELETVDRRITQLNTVSQQLSEAMDLYRNLMQSPYDPQTTGQSAPVSYPQSSFPVQQAPVHYGQPAAPHDYHQQQQQHQQHQQPPPPPPMMNGDPNSR